MMRRRRDELLRSLLAAYQSAIRAGHPDTAQAFADAGVQRPQLTGPQRPTFERHALTPAQLQLLSHLGLPYPDRLVGLAGEMKCSLAQQCGELILVDWLR